MVMKAWRPSMWLPIIMLAWGIVITLTGIVKNFEGLFVARIFVGQDQKSPSNGSLVLRKPVCSLVYPTT